MLFLRDVNGDGDALEFVLYSKESCMDLRTTLVGYSTSRDQVLQYPIVLEMKCKGEWSTKVRFWADHLFFESPIRSGEWKYAVDYRAVGGAVARYHVWYDKSLEEFRGTVELEADAVDAQETADCCTK